MIYNRADPSAAGAASSELEQAFKTSVESTIVRRRMMFNWIVGTPRVVACRLNTISIGQVWPAPRTGRWAIRPWGRSRRTSL